MNKPDEEVNDALMVAIKQAEARTTLWVKIAGAAFGLWSLMIPVGVAMLNSSVETVVASNEKFNVEFKQYVLSMERRVTIIEERQGAVINALKGLDSRTDRLEQERSLSDRPIPHRKDSP